MTVGTYLPRLGFLLAEVSADHEGWQDEVASLQQRLGQMATALGCSEPFTAAETRRGGPEGPVQVVQFFAGSAALRDAWMHVSTLPHHRGRRSTRGKYAWLQTSADDYAAEKEDELGREELLR